MSRSVMAGCRKLTASLFLLIKQNHSFPRSRSLTPHSTPTSISRFSEINAHYTRGFRLSESQNPLIRMGMEAQQLQTNLIKVKSTPNSVISLDPLTFRRFYSSESTNNPDTKKKLQEESDSSNNPDPDPDMTMKHQEIEGPTVERDLSALANESREVTRSLLKTMYNVSSLLAFLGLAHLAMGAFLSFNYSSMNTSSVNTMMLTISALAFGFPFSMAFMLRQSLKPMHFFQKMELIGRLQILTTTMQISKHLRLFFLRLRALSFLCLAGLSLSFLYSLSSSPL